MISMDILTRGQPQYIATKNQWVPIYIPQSCQVVCGILQAAGGAGGAGASGDDTVNRGGGGGGGGGGRAYFEILRSLLPDRIWVNIGTDPNNSFMSIDSSGSAGSVMLTCARGSLGGAGSTSAGSLGNGGSVTAGLITRLGVVSSLSGNNATAGGLGAAGTNVNPISATANFAATGGGGHSTTTNFAGGNITAVTTTVSSLLAQTIAGGTVGNPGASGIMDYRNWIGTGGTGGGSLIGATGGAGGRGAPGCGGGGGGSGLTGGAGGAGGDGYAVLFYI